MNERIEHFIDYLHKWKLTPVVMPKHELAKRDTIVDPQSGRRAGIQYAPQYEERLRNGSDECPICTQIGIHTHSVGDLEALRYMVAFLESKLGILPTTSIVAADEIERLQADAERYRVALALFEDRARYIAGKSFLNWRAQLQEACDEAHGAIHPTQPEGREKK